jgi:type III pantothenate kinase
MLLAVDVGNTHTRYQVFRGGESLAKIRFTTDPLRGSGELRDLLVGLLRPLGGLDELAGACVASVVPASEGSLGEALDFLPCHFVRHSSRLSFELDVDAPEEIGADLLVSAEAALSLAPPPLILVDVGTAITVFALGEGPRFLGGAIAPGLGVAADALFDRGARLPRVPLQAPPQAIGRNSLHCLQSGLVLGCAGLIEGLVERLREELGGQAQVLGTGGGLALLGDHLRCLDQRIEDLTMRGLLLVAQNEGLVTL